jgi:hypothetical protein
MIGMYVPAAGPDHDSHPTATHPDQLMLAVVMFAEVEHSVGPILKNFARGRCPIIRIGDRRCHSEITHV